MNGQVPAAIVAILVIIPLLSIGLWNSDSSNFFEKAEGHSKIVAIASFYPLYEFTKELGGDKVDVSLLVPKKPQTGITVRAKASKPGNR